MEMDNFENNTAGILLAANRPTPLNPALIRSGRFDYHVPVELPDFKRREEILKIHERKIRFDFNQIDRMTSGALGYTMQAVTI